MSRRDLALFGLASLVGALVLFRTFFPPTPPTRQLSVEAITIPSRPIAAKEARADEATWQAPDDIYVVGWAPFVGSPGAQPELFLGVATMTFFQLVDPAQTPSMPVFVPQGAGFLVRRGESVKLRLQITNTGEAGETRGARALLYFHPVAWR